MTEECCWAIRQAAGRTCCGRSGSIVLDLVFQLDCLVCWNVMARAHKPGLVFWRNGRVHLNRRGASVQSTTGSRGVRISGTNAGYTMFRGSVKGTGYPLHSPVSPSLLFPCFTVCHHISTGLYVYRWPYVCMDWSKSIRTRAGKNRLTNVWFCSSATACAKFFLRQTLRNVTIALIMECLRRMKCLILAVWSGPALWGTMPSKTCLTCRSMSVWDKCFILWY